MQVGKVFAIKRKASYPQPLNAAPRLIPETRAPSPAGAAPLEGAGRYAVTDWNKPNSYASLKPWILIDSLTLFQAVMLIFGRDPSYETTGRPEGYVPIATAMKQAIERGELPAQRTVDPYWGNCFYSLEVEDKTFVRQADIRDWLEKIGQREAFFFLTDPGHWPNANGGVPTVTDKPPDTRERTNMLRIIRALAVMANLPDRGAVGSVEMQLQKLGFQAPKEATIRKLLADARVQEPDSKPQ